MPKNPKELTEKQRKIKRLAGLKSERTSFDGEWKSLARFIAPRRGRFETSDRNRGGNRYGSIINSAASFALRTAQAGLLSGVASPSRPWFILQTDDPALREFYPVRVWLNQVERLIRDILNAGNFYSMAPTLFGELLLFGTGAMSHVNDFDDVARFYTHTTGSYWIGQDDRQEVNTFAREYEMTVMQIFEKFGNRGGGADNSHISPTVRSLYDRGNYDSWRKIAHMVEPNEDYLPSGRFSKNFAFKSCYFEVGMSDADNRFLETGGHRMFPVYIPRWGTAGEDIYGTDCPGMMALGDVKQLQDEEKEKAKAIQKMVSPPLQGPPQLKNVPVNGMAGGSVIYDAGTGKHYLRPIHEVDPRLGELRQDMDSVERRIHQAFYVDLFLAITNMEGIQPRNEFELAQRNQERLLQLGPVLERLHGEFLSKVIDRIFDQCVRADILPKPIPNELLGEDLKIQFVSTLAMAQRAVATGAINQIFSFAAGLAKSGWPEAIAKLDGMQAVDEFATATGSIPTLLVPDDVAQQKIAAEQQAKQMAQNLEAAKVMSEAARNASGVDVGDESTLTGALTKSARERAGVSK